MEERNKMLGVIRSRNAEAIEEVGDIISSTYQGPVGRALNAGLSLIVEYLLYAFALGAIIFIFIMEKITPFHLLRQMCDSELINDVPNPHEIKNLSITIRVIIAMLAFFMFGTAYFLRKNRKYKSSIQESISSLKDVKEEMEESDKEFEKLSIGLVAEEKSTANVSDELLEEE